MVGKVQLAVDAAVHRLEPRAQDSLDGLPEFLEWHHRDSGINLGVDFARAKI
jgi:hypothetical protein